MTLDLWYNGAVDIDERRRGRMGRRDSDSSLGGFTPARLVGLEGRLTRPFWGFVGGWAVLCGALASNQLGLIDVQDSWTDDLLNLVLVVLLAELAWGSLWDLATGPDWFRLLAGTPEGTGGWPPERPAALPSLPYSQPASPGGRLVWGLNRLLGWWRETFWPTAGRGLLGILAAAVLATVLTLLLPARLGPLNLALVALVGLGVIQRRHGRAPAAVQACFQVGLTWLAGHAAFAPVGRPSLILALAFVLATWGVLRAGEGLPRGLWLVNGGQVVAVGLLVWLRQPLPAGLAGLLLLGQIVQQPALRFGPEPEKRVDRLWPWLMAAMLVAALALP
jgi:hypothetical protein